MNRSQKQLAQANCSRVCVIRSQDGMKHGEAGDGSEAGSVVVVRLLGLRDGGSQGLDRVEKGELMQGHRPRLRLGTPQRAPKS
jgi:hypothetical protein